MSEEEEKINWLQRKLTHSLACLLALLVVVIVQYDKSSSSRLDFLILLLILSAQLGSAQSQLNAKELDDADDGDDD